MHVFAVESDSNSDSELISVLSPAIRLSLSLEFAGSDRGNGLISAEAKDLQQSSGRVPPYTVTISLQGSESEFTSSHSVSL